MVAPKLLTPLTSKIQDGSFPVIRRNLRGILHELDKMEDGSRMLEVEWMSAGTVWDRCQGIRSPEKVVLYYHGGAYCTMSAQTHRTLTHKISKMTGRRVFCKSVNYRLAPETRFPGGLYDAVQAFLYLTDTERGYGLDPQNILIMGDSAGGGLALATMLYLRDHGYPAAEGAALLSPWVDLSCSYPSWSTASMYDYLPSNPGQLAGMNPVQLYLGPDRVAMVRHPYVSPVFADNFEGLPPLLIQSGGCESLRDEINDLVSKIAATRTTLIHHEEYEDMVHVFQAFPFKKSAEALESIGWWAKFGMSMIAQWKARGLLPAIVEEQRNHTDGPFAIKSTPRSAGRRSQSIPS
ncbi:alpha/beta hydrolase fold-domain-containing protein [Dichotomocladium elegans]|nr:alpha/beta hydrolase fold-domain-containing protein [Dichotomocladium elegans]